MIDPLQPGPGIGRTNQLSLARILYLSFASSIVLFSVLVALVAPTTSDERWSAPAALAGGLAVDVLAVAATATVARRPLDCSSHAALRLTFRSRLFLRLACAQLATLGGFALFVVSGQWWVYPLGAAASLLLLASHVPTERRIADESDALALRGCSRSLLEALQS